MTATLDEVEGTAPEPASPTGRRLRRTRRSTPRNTLTKGAALGLGISMVWFSLLVLIPLAAIVATAGSGGWDQYVTTLSNPQTWAAIRLTVTQAVLITLLNIVMGTVIAWVLVRDRFPGKTVLDVIIDVPFALPLVIREVVPVLQEIGDDQEQAARSLGAGARQTFLRITLPSIKWAVVYGVVLSTARSLGEFGAVKIVSGNYTGRTQTATLVVEGKYQNFEQGAAYATSFLLAFVSIACLVVVAFLRPKKTH